MAKEVFFMQKIRVRQLITLCLAIAMLFSGMYFEKLKVDSQFVACKFPENPATIRAAEPMEVVAHFRRDKEEYRSIAHLMERETEIRNKLNSVVDIALLFVAILLFLTVLQAFLREYRRLDHAAYSSVIIVSYIHKRDGKKTALA